MSSQVQSMRMNNAAQVFTNDRGFEHDQGEQAVRCHDDVRDSHLRDIKCEVPRGQEVDRSVGGVAEECTSPMTFNILTETGKVVIQQCLGCDTR